MDTPEIIAQKSLEFLENAVKNEQQITSTSSLPFPKDVMEKSLFKYIPVVINNGMNVVDVKMKIHLACAVLAGCIEESDAAFVGKIEKILDDLSYKSGNKGSQMNIDEKTKELFITKGGTESEIDHYLKILDGIEIERQKLVAIADTRLQDIISKSLR